MSDVDISFPRWSFLWEDKTWTRARYSLFSSLGCLALLWSSWVLTCYTDCPLIGMASQFVLMPTFAYFLGWAFLQTNFERLGLLILGCSPGGANWGFPCFYKCQLADIWFLCSAQCSQLGGDIVDLDIEVGRWMCNKMQTLFACYCDTNFWFGLVTSTPDL